MRQLEGEQFGRLTVISLQRKDLDGHTYWNCRCICGTYLHGDRAVRGSRLVSGWTRSCGCLRGQNNLKRFAIR